MIHATSSPRLATFLLAALVSACAGKSSPPPAEDPGIKACTKEAKLCPDGSTVGRSGPNCEFDPCPEAPAGDAPTEPVTPPSQ